MERDEACSLRNVVDTHETKNFFVCFAEELSGSFGYQVIGGVLVTAMALVLFAAVSYHCSATWRWLKGLARDGEGEGEDALSKQAAIRISHSLPDLKSEPTRQEYVQDPKDVKKVNILITFMLY